MTDPNKYKEARRKVERVKKFYKNLATWIIMSIGIMILFFFLKLPPFITFIAVSGWGIAIAAEGIELFGLPGFNRNWEQQMMQDELERLEMEERYSTDNVYEFENPIIDSDSEFSISDADEEEELKLKEIKPLPKSWTQDDFV